MNCSPNIITANFSGSKTSATTAALWQWDYGQVLCITGIEDLPAAFEVHFSTNKSGGVSTVAVGADGQVTIPNVLLTIGKSLNAWIYLSDAQGEGETEYAITIPVKARPMPETYDAEATGVFDDVVRQVSEYAETAQTAADNSGESASAATASADSAEASASAAAASEAAAADSAGRAETSKTLAGFAADHAAQSLRAAAEKADEAAASATSAEQSKTAAANAATSAGQSEQTAAQSATAATTASANAAASATDASASATAAAASATAASGDASTASTAAQTATAKAGEASAAATAAEAAKDAAVTAQTAAETSATNAGQSASTATAKAAEAVQSASGAAQSKTDAEAAATRAEQAAATLTVDTALSDTSTNPVQNKVITGELTDVKSAIQYQATLNSGYIVYHSGEIKSSSSRHYSEFPVSEGMQVIYKFTTATYSFGLAFYNTGGKYISGNAAVANTVQTVTVPAGAVLCRATVSKTEEAIPITYNSAITKNREEIIKSVRIENSGFEYETNKYAYATQATVSSYTGVNVIAFSVYPGLAFTYKYTRSSSSAIGLHFRDANDAFVSGLAATSAAQTVTAPENAVICYASVSNALDIEFLTVGNSLLSYLSTIGKKTSTGISTTSAPLEYLHDDPGMLDIFLHVGCIGDSLASGESYWNDGGEVHGNDFYQYSWGQYLARKTGNTYYNWSRGGMTTKTWLASEYATECFDGQHLCEAYIIGLGQNDNNVGMTIGTSADIDLTDYNNNADTFYGNYGKIIQKIKEVQPQAKIFVITDPNYGMNNSGYNAPIRDMATIFDNVYVIDMQAYGYKYYINAVLNAQMRGSHYNAYGYKVFSVMIANYIDWIVTTRYTEFTQVELIGTGHSWTPSQ